MKGIYLRKPSDRNEAELLSWNEHSLEIVTTSSEKWFQVDFLACIKDGFVWKFLTHVQKE